MSINRNGPTRFDITDYRCAFCRFHDQPMIQSGRNPIYEHYCKHEEAVPQPFDEIGTAELPHRDRGRFIGQHDRTPSWCPMRNQPRPDNA